MLLTLLAVCWLDGALLLIGAGCSLLELDELGVSVATQPARPNAIANAPKRESVIVTSLVAMIL